MWRLETKDGPEFGFTWTCPECDATQVDFVHPDLGPFLMLTCGTCESSVLGADIHLEEFQEWESAKMAARESRK